MTQIETPAELDLSTVPLWRIRTRLFVKSFRKNWKIFNQNRFGTVGVAIIALFAVAAIAHPILEKTLWEGHEEGGVNVYDPRAGADSVIVSMEVVPDDAIEDPRTQVGFSTAFVLGNAIDIPEIGSFIDVPQAPAAPTFGGPHPHWLGTDPFGGDIFSKLLVGARVAFLLGAVAAISTVVLGTLVGTIAAYAGGWVDTALMRLADMMILIPILPLLIVLSAFFDFSIVYLGALIGVFGGLGGTAIVLKSQALSVKVRAFIDAARVAGGGPLRIITFHMIPNVLPLSFLYLMFAVTGAIFTEATLSFFGLLNIEQSWGIMINIAHTQGYTLQGLKVWWLMVPAGLSVTLFSAGFFMISRALDEVVNPRLRKR